MHCVRTYDIHIHCMKTGSSSSRHFVENVEESVRKRIARMARNAVQEIDRIAQIVSANDSSCSPARIESSSSSTSPESSPNSASTTGTREQ